MESTLDADRSPRSRHRPRLRLVALAGLVAVVGMVAGGLGGDAAPSAVDRPPSAPPRPTASRVPSAPAGVVEAGAARYAVGSPSDTVAIADWACTGTPTPALVRSSDGVVFVFEQWAVAGHDVTGRATGVLPAGASLVAPSPCGAPVASVAGRTTPLLPISPSGAPGSAR